MTVSDTSPANYDRWYETPIGRLTDALEKEAVFSLIKEPSGLALDLSCGTGNYAFALARRGWKVIGIDRSLAMLRLARGKSRGERGRPLFAAGDAMALPLRDRSVALVTLILGLEFMIDPAQALTEARRVLCPEGVMIVAVLAPRGLWTRWRRIKRRFVLSVWRDARFLASRNVARILNAAGFRVAGHRAAVHYLPVTRSARWLTRWESVAARVAPDLASFVALRCETAN
jgi:ubiquinone/menaquinone biosynthesis C-methylase UbiE